MNPLFSQAITEIAADNRSGAAQIAERAADILLRRAGTGEAASPDAFRQELLATGWALIRAQPIMAPLVNLVNAVVWKLEEREHPSELRLAVAQATDEFKRQIRQNALRVAEGALGLIPDGGTIITLAHSGTVEQALLHARRAGRRFSVICLESRPACEGREAAASLANADIPVTLVVDAAAVAMVEIGPACARRRRPAQQPRGDQQDRDACAGAGGPGDRHPLLHAVRRREVPAAGLPRPEQQDWPAAEVWAEVPPGVTVRNHYFEWTPLRELSGIVTEQGILPVAAVEGWLAAIRLHPALASNSLERAAV